MDVQFKALMDSANDAIVVADAATGTVVDCNASALRLLGVTHEQFVGANHTMMLPPEMHPKYVEIFEQLADGQPIAPLEVQLLHSNGGIVWVEASGNACSVDGRRLVVGVFRDITERRRARDELRRLNRTLLAISACDEAIMEASDEAALKERVTELLVQSGVCCVSVLMCFDGAAPAIVVQTGRDGLAVRQSDLPALKSLFGWTDTNAGRAISVDVRHGGSAAQTACLSWTSADDAAAWSLVSLPLNCESGSQGALLLILSGQQIFDEHELAMLDRLVDHLCNGLDTIRAKVEREKALETVEYRLAFEAILTSAIQGFFRLGGHDVDALIQEVWRKIGAFLGLDHSVCVLFETGGFSERCFDWQAPGQQEDCASLLENVSRLARDHRDTLQRGEALVWPVEGSQDDTGPRSGNFLLVPVEDEGELVGVQGLCTGAQSRAWAREDIDMLKSAGQIILGAIRLAGASRLLEESEQRLRMVLDAASNGVFDIDFSTGRAYYGENWAHMLGYELGDIEPTFEGVLALVHPDDVGIVNEALQAHSTGLTPHYVAEFRMRNSDGNWQWVLSRGKIVERDAEGVPRRLVGAHTDISVRKRTEEALQWSTARQHALLQAIPDTLLRVRPDGEIFDVHVAEQSPLADAWRACLGQRLYDVFPEAVAEQAMHRVHRALEHNRTQVFEFRGHTPGFEGAFEARAVPAHNSEILLIIRDVSERNRLEREILEISERERTRLGQDLHDGLGQHLVGIEFLLDALTTELTRAKSPLADNARTIAAQAAEATQQTRSLARGLHIAGLGGDGLAAALEELASRTGAVYDVDCRFLRRGAIRLPEEEANQVYRIAQEAVANAVKHAQPGCVSIHLSQNDRRLRLVVEDNGVGFDPSANTGPGMGLHIMRYRARVLAASLEVDSEPGHGARVVCSLPYARRD